MARQVCVNTMLEDDLFEHFFGCIGNGKTISLKTIMKTCGDKGFSPLYVKSFKSTYSVFTKRKNGLVSNFTSRL